MKSNMHADNDTDGQKSILFVCTGNTFRSLSAEVSFKKYLSDHAIDGWRVGSAGIIASPQPIDPKTLKVLGELGMDATAHQAQRLTGQMLKDYDVIVGMAEDHIAFMKSEFGYTYGMLFNELASGEATSVPDIGDEVPDYRQNRPAVEEKIDRTIREIAQKIPSLFESASERFYIFSDFIAGKATDHGGDSRLPFIPLYETPHSITFMSVDIPSTEDGHVLVIPKKRYAHLAEIPDNVLEEIFASIKKIGDVFTVEHDGYNLLLNNGLGAGQYIIHTHFHIIPRRKDDGITVEGWQHPKINREDFIRLNEKLKHQIESSSASRS